MQVFCDPVYTSVIIAFPDERNNKFAFVRAHTTLKFKGFRSVSVSVSALEQFVTNDETIEATKIHTPFTISKTVLPYHMSRQGFVRAYLGIQITRHDHNFSFTKPLLKCM